MIQALVDASRRNAHRVGRSTVPLDPGSGQAHYSAAITGVSPEMRLALDKLHKLDPLTADTVWLRCVEGFTIEETAARQRRSVAKVRQDYAFGLKWIRKHFEGSQRQ